MLKRILTVATALLMLLSVNVYAENEEYKIGSYYQLGKYNGAPIIWRCISTNDENGILMVSDKILCFKAANAGDNSSSSIWQEDLSGSNFWEESTIRQWLNSTSENSIEWSNYPPDIEHIKVLGFGGNYPYANEVGFLSEGNFSKSERSVMKTINQWVALPINKLDLSTNGKTVPFMIGYLKSKNLGESYTVGTNTILNFPEAYKGAMYRVSDTVFLLNECQLKKIVDVYGTAMTDSIYEPISKTTYYYKNYHPYWLVSPSNEGNSSSITQFNAVFDGNNLNSNYSFSEYGIRPGFYLNKDTAYIVSGNGTEDNPYVLDGKAQDGITVFSNGEQLEFNQTPVIENDHTLVGVRSVFESLGAEVEWDGAEKVVTASNEDTTIKLQIDNNIMQVNDEEVELDTPACLINDNTMVPLRAVSEAFNAKVDWIEDLQRIVIDVQPEWVESDWNPVWYQQALRAGGYVK